MIDIPVLSELVKFTHPKELCQLSCASKTLHIDLQGTKAWARLAEAQLPPPTPRDDSEARSHVWRREVAKALPHPRRVLEGVTLLEALSRETPAPFEFTRNRFTDFTYFLRLEDSGRLIWEGDLGDLSRESYEEGQVLRLSLRHMDFGWLGPADNDDLEQVQIALVAIRNHDQAMVPLGQFDFHAAWSDSDGDPRNLRFRPRRSLFYSPRSQLNLLPCLSVAQDANDRRLELGLSHIIREPREVSHTHTIYRCNLSPFRSVLTYLAGIHNPIARASILARIEGCFVAGERRRGWLELERARVKAERVARVEALRERDEIDVARAEAQLEALRKKDTRIYSEPAIDYEDYIHECCTQAEYELKHELLVLERERELAALLERVEARRELREQDEAEASRAEQEREEAEYERNNEAEASRAEAQLECERRRHWDPFFTLELEHEREEAARVARVEALREQDAVEASQAEAHF